jgi:signal transduction histidine kinase/DNA-binding NarL/FixJ family response regulator
MARRVILVDDHAGFRARARALLQAEGLDVVGEARTGAEALDVVQRIGADIVLLDVVLPERDGFDVAEAISSLPHPPAVILTSSRDATDFGDRLARAPVHGFLPKAEVSAAAIDRLVRGGGRQDGASATSSRRLVRVPTPAAPPPARGRARLPILAEGLSPAWVRLAAWPASLAVGLIAVYAMLTSDLLATGSLASDSLDPRPVIAGVALVGWSTAIAGLGAWWRRPDRYAGPLLVAAAWAWFIGAASWATDGGAFQGYYVLLMAALLVTYPSGRLASPAARLLVAFMLAVLAASTVGRLAFDAGPAGYNANCVLPDPLCAPIPEAFIDATSPGSRNQTALDLYNTLDLGFQLALFAGAALSLAAVAYRSWRATGPQRRVLAPSLALGIALTAAVGLAVLRRQPGSDTAIPEALGAGLVVALAALPHAFTWDLVRGHLARTKVADLVVRLGASPTREGMRGALGRALSDRSVSVLVWSPDAAAYLDEAGQPTALPDKDPARSFTLLERQGQLLGAIVYDAALREDPGLLASVSAAAATAIENDRLQGEVQAQLAEVQASRARIVASADEQRQRLERDLHDGAQQQLVALAIDLRSARLRVDAAAQPELARTLVGASARADSAISELRELARGIHPVVLTEAGLAAALESLAQRAPFPVTVEAPLPARLPAAVEATAYFLVAEALTNSAKHARAREARVRAELIGDRLHIEVADDGIGGADLAGGTGLRGLADRVAALNGSLRLESPSGGGTRLAAEIPCAS